MRTPGIMGLSGKCPGKKLSLMVTFLIATADTPGVYSITLSTNRNGNLHNTTSPDIESEQNNFSLEKQCVIKLFTCEAISHVSG